jgi:hypothetical protein
VPTHVAPAVSLALVVSAFSARDAFAGNGDMFMMGNDAAMMGGAVTATARGSTAVWYNPAGVDGENVHIPRSRLAADPGNFHSVDVAFNAYAVRFGGSPDVIADASKGGSREKLTNVDFSPVPTALAYTRRIGGFQLGAGLFVPNRGVYIPRTLARVTDGDRVTSVVVDGNNKFSEYYAGFALGGAVTERFRVGAALFGYYSKQLDTEGIYAGTTTLGGEHAFAFSHTTTDRMRLGGQLVWGMQWMPTDAWQFGVTFRSPVLSAYQSTQTVDLTGGAVEGQRESNVVFQENKGSGRSVLRPMRVHFGAGFTHDGWQLGLDGSVQAPHVADRVEDSTRSVWNVRAGVLRTVNNKVSIGGGLFTDRSPYDPATAFRYGSIHYYGVTVALRLGELLTVRSEDDPKERPLLFGSTFAVSYAYGTGTFGNQELTPIPGGARTELRLDPVTAHEIVFHVGSTLSR